MPTHLKVWRKIAGDWKLDHLDELTTETSREGLNGRIQMLRIGNPKDDRTDPD